MGGFHFLQLWHFFGQFEYVWPAPWAGQKKPSNSDVVHGNDDALFEKRRNLFMLFLFGIARPQSMNDLIKI